MERIEIGKYLVIDPEICHGQLTFKGTRVPVDTVLYFLSVGEPMEKLNSSWPEINREAIEEAVDLAVQALKEKHGNLEAAVVQVAS